MCNIITKHKKNIQSLTLNIFFKKHLTPAPILVGASPLQNNFNFGEGVGGEGSSLDKGRLYL